MRIISGKFKGRRINPPTNITARPTTDFAKEGLFNLLANKLDFEEITALDLFAGTGSISVELISRGCRQVTAVEQNLRQYDFIRKVSKDFNIDNIVLLKADVFKFIERTKIKYDFIFADPPYELSRLKDIPDIIFSKELLNSGGLFALEHSVKNDFSGHPNFIEQRHYGNVIFSFFQNNIDKEKLE